MADLRLSQELIDNIQQTIVAVDPAAQDSSITLQYLAAVTGYILGGQQDMPKNQKEDYLEQLNAFTKHVLDDVCKPSVPAAAAANAFGVWKP
jgi:hypothetical protein